MVRSYQRHELIGLLSDLGRSNVGLQGSLGETFFTGFPYQESLSDIPSNAGARSLTTVWCVSQKWSIARLATS